MASRRRMKPRKTVWFKHYPMTPLGYALMTDATDEAIDHLIQKGADVNGLSEELTESYKGKEDLVKLTPLHYAMNKNRMDVFHRLIASGADINKQSGEMAYIEEEGGTVLCNDHPILFWAVMDRKIDFIKVILNTGLVRNLDSCTPLHLACSEKDNVDVIRLVLDYGFLSNQTDKHMVTPMLYLVDCDIPTSSTVESIKLLLRYGYDFQNDVTSSHVYSLCDKPSHEQIRIILKDWFSSPLSLMMSCRIQILRNLGQRYRPDAINSFPIPKSLKKFLME